MADLVGSLDDIASELDNVDEPELTQCLKLSKKERETELEERCGKEEARVALRLTSEERESDIPNSEPQPAPRLSKYLPSQSQTPSNIALPLTLALHLYPS